MPLWAGLKTAPGASSPKVLPLAFEPSGLAVFDGQTVMVIGHQKGRTTKENITRNFAQANPEGFRKAQRLMKHAARFGFPRIALFSSHPALSTKAPSDAVAASH